jgi:Subtilase family
LVAERRRTQQRTAWYRRGEFIVAAQVPRDQPLEVTRAQVLRMLQQQMPAGVLETEAPVEDPVVFSAPGREQSLAFMFFTLADRRSRGLVRNAVETAHRSLARGSRGDSVGMLSASGIQAVGVMPHWNCAACYMGPSPGTFPRPIDAVDLHREVVAHQYRTVEPRLGGPRRLRRRESVPVVVLDTAPNWQQARRRARETFARNEQLGQLVDLLGSGSTPDRTSTAARQARRVREDVIPPASSGEPAAFPMADHGLFIAGLIHDIAPNAPLELVPVLTDVGGGDLSLLLRALAGVLERKDPSEPLIINLSLGLMPHPEHLPAIWYGLPHRMDANLQADPHMQTSGYDWQWVGTHRQTVSQTMDLLVNGGALLMDYLQDNNCLVVAAAGNDSLQRVEHHEPRLGPRLPARYASVLGVAATTSDPRDPAAYSNIGDEYELDVAAFGGNATERFEPEDGVIGVYSGEFPDGRPNETGWARWSGTSFAAAFVSGVAANYWAAHRGRSAAEVLVDVRALADRHGPYVGALRAPAVAIHGEWH